MRYGPQNTILHPRTLALAGALSVLLLIILVVAALRGDLGNPTMITNLLMIATGVVWLGWWLACLIRPRPKAPEPKVPDVYEVAKLIQSWRN